MKRVQAALLRVRVSFMKSLVISHQLSVVNDHLPPKVVSLEFLTHFVISVHLVQERVLQLSQMHHGFSSFQSISTITV